jgi:hypothetical protein
MALLAQSARAQIGDLVGPASGELTAVSTVDPIKVYYTRLGATTTEFGDAPPEVW